MPRIVSPSTPATPCASAAQAAAFWTSFFVAVVTMAPLVSSKWISGGQLHLSGSVLLYPLTFFIAHIVAVVYGLRQAILLVAHGAFTHLLVGICLGLVRSVPTATASPIDTQVFDQIFPCATPTSSLYALLVYGAVQLANVGLFAWLRQCWGQGRLGVCSGGAAGCAQLVHAVLAMAGGQALSSWAGSVLGAALLLSGGVVLLGMLLVGAGVRWTQRWGPPQAAAGAAREGAPRADKAAVVYRLCLSVFIATLLLTNVITVKYLALGPVVLTAGALTYPFTFLLIDTLSELYGPTHARLAVWLGLIVSLLMTALVQMIVHLPVSPLSPVRQEVFEGVFGFTPGIVLGSMVAYGVAQFTDIYLFDGLRRLTQGRYLWLRNNGSTLISQGIDTLLFGLIAWIVWPIWGWSGGLAPLPWAAWYAVMLYEYGFKVIFTIVSTPLVYLSVAAVQQWRQE